MGHWSRVCLLAAAAAPISYLGSSTKFENPAYLNYEETYNEKVKRAKKAIHRYMLLNGVPGISVGVTVNGKAIWRSGVGFADVEQSVPCTGSTVMRIASISKSITAVIASRLVEEGKLDVDAPIQTYVPSFPRKKFEGKDVEITCRHLLSHTSGIRHYKVVSFREFTITYEIITISQYFRLKLYPLKRKRVMTTNPKRRKILIMNFI